MTEQEAFNAVWERAKDKRRATDEGGTNCYRTDEGDRCFIGVLIPEDQYDPTMERFRVESLALAGRLPFLEGVDRALLRALQRVHDAQPPARWANALRDVAARYGLEVPE